MKVLITGISSEVGRALSAELLSLGHDIVGVDVQPHDTIPPEVEFNNVDVRDSSALADIAQSCQAGLHLAIRAGDTSVRDIFDVNVTGAYNFLTAAKQASFRTAILASSAPVHLPFNDGKPGRIAVTSSGAGHTYDVSKHLQEEIFRDFHAHGVPSMCLRFGHIVRGQRGVNLSRPIPLQDFDYCRGGWVALEDIVTACAKALELTPDRNTFECLNLIGSAAGRDRFNVEAAEKRLGFKMQYDFSGYD